MKVSTFVSPEVVCIEDNCVVNMSIFFEHAEYRNVNTSGIRPDGVFTLTMDIWSASSQCFMFRSFTVIYA